VYQSNLYTKLQNWFAWNYTNWKLFKISELYFILFFATVSFKHFCVVTTNGYWLLHVCSSLCLTVVSERLPLEEFPWDLVWELSRKSAKKIHIWLKSGKNIGHFTKISDTLQKYRTLYKIIGHFTKISDTLQKYRTLYKIIGHFTKLSDTLQNYR